MQVTEPVVVLLELRALEVGNPASMALSLASCLQWLFHSHPQAPPSPVSSMGITASSKACKSSVKWTPSFQLGDTSYRIEPYDREARTHIMDRRRQRHRNCPCQFRPPSKRRWAKCLTACAGRANMGHLPFPHAVLLFPWRIHTQQQQTIRPIPETQGTDPSCPLLHIFPLLLGKTRGHAPKKLPGNNIPFCS